MVFIVSAFDFFMHEITKFGLGKIFDGEWKPTIKYSNINISLEVLNKALKNGESSEWFLEFVNEQFAKTTMVSYAEVKEQVNLLGLNMQVLADDTFYQLGSKEKTIDKLKNCLNGLFFKRNVIAHQSDRKHANAEIMEITEEFVRGYMNKIVDGNNPINNLPVAEDSVLNNPNVIRCMFFVKDILEEVRKNDKVDFPVDALNTFIYREDKSISRFAEQINESIDENVYKKINYKLITDWLKLNGFLQEKYSEEFKKTITMPTEKGLQIGIRAERRSSSRGVEYMLVIYDRQAQEYIIQSMGKILCGECCD